VIERLRAGGDEVVVHSAPLGVNDCDADFLVSFGYRYIVARDILARFPHRAVNLHISYLPWNRGAHPNVWAHYEGTPSGVTVHHMDPGIDTGDIIVQKQITFGPGETLQTSHAALMREIEDLFFDSWPSVKAGTAPRSRQQGRGSYHSVADLERIQSLLTNGWDTPLAAIAGRGVRT
jgi:methionyl-tRNA formyltransferase